MKAVKVSTILILSLGMIAIMGSMMMTYSGKKVNVHDGVSIVNRWELPEALDEISGVAWLENNTVACIQDEDGIIFLYDLEQNEIIKQIPFGPSGDYEGIAVNGEDAYVMRSDGKVFEVARFRESEKPITTSFQTGFTAKNNMETIAMDPTSNSLVVAPKDRDRGDNFKGLYKIALDSKQTASVPTVKINLKDTKFKQYLHKKVYRTFSPSDVAIHPETGDFYVLEGTNPKLVILKPDGAIAKVIRLDKGDFPQPEGITFSPEGALYISNEAGSGRATILEVNL